MVALNVAWWQLLWHIAQISAVGEWWPLAVVVVVASRMVVLECVPWVPGWSECIRLLLLVAIV